jgi:hypothetical protein
VRIRYVLTADDGLRFCEYHIRHSPIVGRQIARERYLYPLAGIAIGLAYWWATERMEVLVAAAMLGAGWTLWWPVRWRRGYIRQARRMYAEPENQSLFGEHVASVEPDHLLVRSAAGIESTYPWTTIHEVVEEPGYLYVYLNGLEAITVPTDGIVEGDVEAFRDEVVRRVTAMETSGR